MKKRITKQKKKFYASAEKWILRNSKDMQIQRNFTTLLLELLEKIIILSKVLNQEKKLDLKLHLVMSL